MSKMKTHDHNANQRGMNQVMSKPSSSTVGRVGTTGPIQKPSPSTMTKIGVTPPKTGGKSMSGKKRVRQAEEATSPSTDSSNGG